MIVLQLLPTVTWCSAANRHCSKLSWTLAVRTQLQSETVTKSDQVAELPKRNSEIKLQCTQTFTNILNEKLMIFQICSRSEKLSKYSFLWHEQINSDSLRRRKPQALPVNLDQKPLMKSNWERKYFQWKPKCSKRLNPKAKGLSTKNLNEMQL